MLVVTCDTVKVDQLTPITKVTIKMDAKYLNAHKKCKSCRFKLNNLYSDYLSSVINKASDHKQVSNVQIIFYLNKTRKYQDLFVYVPLTASLFVFAKMTTGQQFETFLELATYI